MAEFKSMDRRKFIRKSSLGMLALPLIMNTSWVDGDGNPCTYVVRLLYEREIIEQE